MDVVLCDAEGKPLDMTSPFEIFNDHCFPFAASGLSDEARRNRDRLAEFMAVSKVTNYPSEYWHWSYGDQGWAYRSGHPAALYQAIEPEGYKADPLDVVDEPLAVLPFP